MIPRTGLRVLAVALAVAALAACDKPQRPPKQLRAPNVAKRLAAQLSPAPARPTVGYVFSPLPEPPESREPAGYFLDFCQAPTGGRNQTPVPIVGPFPPPVRTTELYADTATLLQPAFRCAIRDADDWTDIQVLGRMVVDRKLILDFGREMVLLAGTGAKPSGGYAIRFDSVVVRRDTLWAFVGTRSTPPGAVLAAEPFSAVDVLRLPRFDGTIVFVEEELPVPGPPRPLGKEPKERKTRKR